MRHDVSALVLTDTPRDGEGIAAASFGLLGLQALHSEVRYSSAGRTPSSAMVYKGL